MTSGRPRRTAGAFPATFPIGRCERPNAGAVPCHRALDHAFRMLLHGHAALLTSVLSWAFIPIRRSRPIVCRSIVRPRLFLGSFKLLQTVICEELKTPFPGPRIKDPDGLRAAPEGHRQRRVAHPRAGRLWGRVGYFAALRFQTVPPRAEAKGRGLSPVDSP